MKSIVLFIAVILALFMPGQGFSADSASFDPTPVSITSQGAIPVGTVITWSSSVNPPDMAKWLDCNGQAVPSGSQYDRLRSVLGAGKSVPNYNDQFLRGTTTLADVGKTFSDSLKSHSHYIDPHQHDIISGSVNVSGTTSPQYFSGSTSVSYVMPVAGVTSTSISPPYGYMNGVFVTTTATATGTVSGWTDGGTFSGSGTISGQTNMAGGGNTHETGEAETAPKHIKVRYLIRAIP
jgi:hypothetical protein